MRVLLAIDDSEFSEAAANALASKVHAKGTEVLVLRVLEPIPHTVIPRMEPAYTAEMAAQLEDDRKQANESVFRTADLLRRAGFQVDTRVAENEVRAAILEIASEWQADLIVVGSHGRKGLQKFLLGSVAESVMRHAKCSVWVVRIPPRS
jgi:nucleotide-binding universal stress UspA family protein